MGEHVKLPITIVTAADVSSCKRLRKLQASIRRHEANETCIIYDIGMVERQVTDFMTKGWTLRRFDFENYPQHFQSNHSIQPCRPVIISRLLTEFECVVWINPELKLMDRMRSVRAEMKRCGLYFQGQAGVVGVNRNFPGITEFMDRWVDLAMADHWPRLNAIRALIEDWKKATNSSLPAANEQADSASAEQGQSPGGDSPASLPSGSQLHADVGVMTGSKVNEGE